jgi:hypothetical protein
MSNTKSDNPKPEDKVCFNCSHMLWLVGLGQGVKCGLTMKQIPNRWYTCDKFKKKDKK